MESYYSSEDLADIKSAKSYKDLLVVALRVLEFIRNKYPRESIVMVCGPISTGGRGSRKTNLEIFKRAIDRLSSEEFLIFSQMPFENDMERLYKSDPKLQGLRLLEEFYLPIFETGYIDLLYFLPGWENSTGAKWEHDQAERLNILKIYLDESYILD